LLVLAVLGVDPAARNGRLEHVAFADGDREPPSRFGNWDDLTNQNTEDLLSQGREIFRFETYGDEAFWGGNLHLNQALETLKPAEALALGLKVDADALPPELVKRIQHQQVNLQDPKVTLRLLELKAVLGVTGFFTGDRLTSVGFQCALCHSTVNDSVAPGIGQRLDGWANRDLNVGAIVASAPNLQFFVERLGVVHPGITADTVRDVLRTWGPGKFDAELLLDGKAFQPDGRSAAALIPNAFDLAGFNLHTWTGGWGTLTYWNAFVAVNELRGIGTFLDERFDDATQFPIAARFKAGHVSVGPDEDRVTSKLPALHFYQLSIPAPKPLAGVDFDADAAERGHELFSGKARCNNCHHQPLWTEPGWNQHTADELKIDSFEADRSPGHAYKTMNLAGIFVRERGLFMFRGNQGRFYHDGRFATLRDVVSSYDSRFNLGLTDAEMTDLVEYLKSL
jgi:hypothetical protein